MFDVLDFGNLIESKSTTITPSKFNNQSFIKWLKRGPNSFTTASENYEKYNQNSALSDAIDMIATKFSEIRPIIESETEDSTEITKSHDVLAFLKAPNKIEDYHDFSMSMATNYLIDRNSYLETLGFFRSPPEQIYNVRNSDLTITELANSAIYLVTGNNFFDFLSGEFRLDRKTGRIIDKSRLRELTHIRGFYLSTGELRSISKIVSILRDVDILIQSDVHNLAHLEKGFKAGGILSIDTEDNDGFERFTKDVSDIYSGANNQGKIMTSKGQSVSYTSIDQNNRDMQVNETKRDSRNTIYQRYEIPRPLVDNSSQTYNNYQTALFALYDNAVLPLANKLYAGLSKIFRNRGMLDDNQRITYDVSSITALQLRRNEELKALSASGILSTNEMRSIAGYESFPGGDDILVPLNKVPLGQDSFTGDERTQPSQSPSKKFIEIMKKNGCTDEEVKQSWSLYGKDIK